MSFTAVTLPPSTSTSSSADSRSRHRYFKKPPRHSFTYHHHHAELTFGLQSPIPSPSRSRVFVLRASKRGGPSSSLVDDPPRNWSRSIMSSSSGFVLDDDDHYDDDDDDEEEDRSVDLLVRFVQNAFKKISKRARKALRSVLPLSISTKLVGFSVNGVLLLAFLWVLKAFLEVVCTLGSVVFVSILLIRGIWSGVTYLHEGHNLKMNELDDDHRAWTGAQPATYFSMSPKMAYSKKE